MVSTREYLDFATDAAFQAGQLTLAHFQTGVDVGRKSDTSPVTVADRSGEKLLRELIGKRFPDHGIYGEEMGKSNNDSSHRWILDPIDGTQSFIRGVPLYGVLLGLEIDAEVIAGVCYFPALGEMLAGGRGEGCRWNGREARVSRVDSLSSSVVSMTEPGSLDGPTHQRFWENLKKAAGVVRGYCDCYGHCLVATGRCEIMLDPVMNPWDCAALVPIVEEAGGTFTDWSGERTIYGGSAVSTNGILFEALMEMKA